MQDRLAAQLAFVIEADRLKSVIRANTLADGSRLENSAEHSWHLCLWAFVFADQSQGAHIPCVMQMLLLHDVGQIDLAGAVSGDEDTVLAQKRRPVPRLFALLPRDQAQAYGLLHDEFEAGQTTDARYARRIHIAAPMFLELSNPVQTQADHDRLRATLETGRFATLHDDWPQLYRHAANLLGKRRLSPLEPMASRLRFVMEADRLKSVLRGTTLCDGTRRENSAEHSWHIMLWALTLAEHSEKPAKIDHVLLMLLLHDIVEIDAGDNPIHGTFDAALVAAQEQAAADRLFGLLPPL